LGVSDGVEDVVAALWAKNRPTMLERVEVLRATFTALADDAADVDLGAARDAAHKLAGSLGMYGFPRSSELAMRVEHALVKGDMDTSALLADVDEMARDLSAT
jgi:HPt (histidine-containing phosphotransfer) domain-containing protein